MVSLFFKNLFLKKKLVFLIFISLYFNLAFAEITQISNLSPIISATQRLDSNDLVIFDVDDVLIRKKDLILNSVHKEYNHSLANEIPNRHSKQDSEQYWSIVLLSAKNELIDPKIVNIIKNIQKKGVKTLALTSIMTGKLGKIPSLEDWDIERLSQNNINFHNSWENVLPYQFTNLVPKEPNRYPTFKNGIIFTAGLAKGEILKQFLHHANFKPKKIIFIDDKLKNLESVEAFCAQENIGFTGFEYVASKNKSQAKLDIERAKFQYQYLEKEHKWLSDREADKKMENSKKTKD